MVWFWYIIVLGICCVVCCFLRVSVWRIIKRISKYKVTAEQIKKDIVHSLVKMYIAIVLVGGFSIVTNAYPAFMRDIVSDKGEKQQISTLDSDKKKEIDDIFPTDSDKGEDAALKREIDKKLHMEWADESLKYRGYGEKIVELYFAIPQREDEPYDKNSQATEEIQTNNMIIREIQAKRLMDDVITKEDIEKEWEAYWKSFLKRPVAQMAYQAGRSAEDLFWGQAEVDDMLKSGADAIFAFETFLGFENREVGEGDQKRTVDVEEILLRNGKTFFRLGIAAEDEKEKKHYLFCAYGLFSNVNLEGTAILDNASINENVMLAEYYKGLTIANLPLDLIDSVLINESQTSFAVASKLLENNKIATAETKQKEEQEMPRRLEELENKISRIVKWKK